MSLNKTNIGLLLGDPSGIGPELTVKLLDSDVSEKANILIIGEKKVLEDGQEIVGKKIDLKFVDKFDDVNFDGKTKFFLDISKGTNRSYVKKQVCAESGKSVLEATEIALSLAKKNKIHAINFAPMNKASLIQGGCEFNDEHELFQNRLNVKDFCCEFNVVDNFWTARVTSHIPIKEVAQNITKENILKPIKLLNKTLKMSGIVNPRIAVQALNPHAEFGTEEKDEIIPAIEEAKKMGINDLKKKYELNEIVSGDSIFCATGITSGDLVSGIEIQDNEFISETLVTHKSSGLKKVIKLKQNL